MRMLMPATLDYMRRHELWDDYYYTWSLLPSRYSFTGKSELSLREAMAIQSDADERNSAIGKAIAQFCRGVGYFMLERYAEAERDLRASLQALNYHRYIYAFHHAYLFLCFTLSAEMKYEEMYSTTLEWRQHIDEYVKKYDLPEQRSCELILTNMVQGASALSLARKYDQAGLLIMQIDSICKACGREDRVDLSIMKSQYLSATGQLDKAIVAARDGIRIARQIGDTQAYIRLSQMLAENLVKTGRHAEATEEYARLLPVYSKAVEKMMRSNLEEYEEMYDVNSLAARERLTGRLLVAIVTLIVFIIAGVAYAIFYNRWLRKKRRQLFDTVNEMRKAEQGVLRPSDTPTDGYIDSKHKLFLDIVRLMDEERLYTMQRLNRDTLAKRAGSNRTYVAEAIRTYTGMSVQDFINHYRLNYSATLLKTQPDMAIADVAVAAGFATRSTFNRAFQEAYSLTPTEYRNEASQEASSD